MGFLVLAERGGSSLSIMAQPLTAFLGLSHLGIVSGAGWASMGHPTLGIDPSAETIRQLRQRDLPILEPGLPELFERAGENLAFVDDLAALNRCQLVIISRDMPTDDSNAADQSVVADLVDSAIPHLAQGVTIAVMSQVTPGFNRALRQRIRLARPELEFDLFCWVETLIFGRAVERFLHPERLIIGCADPDRPLPPVLQDPLERFGCSIVKMRYESAELTKTAINTFLASSVTCTNTLADLAERIGADWSEIAPALKLDRRIGPYAYLAPSLGIAGGNLERDLVTLLNVARAEGADSTLLEALLDHNRGRYAWITRQLREHVFSRAARPVIALWGLTYKKNTTSTKNSPALRLISELEGKCDLRAWDPAVARLAEHPDVIIAADDGSTLDGADALLIMADWDVFAETDVADVRRRLRTPLVIDCVGVWQSIRDRLDGIQYISMGWPGSAAA